MTAVGRATRQPAAVPDAGTTPDDPRGATSTPEVPSRPRRWGRRLGWGLALVAVVAVPWWGKAGLQRLDFFHVRAIEVQGTRYLDPSVVVQRLEVDTLHSVWNELAPLAQRLRSHPLVLDARLDRRLPGTLVVTVTERTPVAFVATGDGLQVRDAEGNVLPIDPSRQQLDLPVLTVPDTSVLRLLGELRASHSGLYARLSDVRRDSPRDLSFRLYTTTIRARADVSAQRLADIQLVEADLARRQQHAVELDLRFRDQVIARLP